MIALAKELDVLSSVLVLVGLVWGAVGIRASERRLRAERSTIRRLMLERETRPATERMAHDEPTLADLVRAEGLTLPVLGDALTQPRTSS